MVCSSSLFFLNSCKKDFLFGDNQYDTDINNDRGAFFALSEAWAEFIGQSYASRKYGTTNLHEVTWNTEQTFTLYNALGPYTTHLENQATFFNSFIPKGLFHDLMDNFDSDEPFDRIGGRTILQIYNRLNDNTWTIQAFRDNWEAAFPSIHNTDLFDAYNIN